MLSRKKLINCIDLMIGNFYSDPDPLKVRLTNFHNWLECSKLADLVDLSDYDYLLDYGYEKIKNMEDYDYE